MTESSRGVLFAYRANVAAGDFNRDERQILAAEKLQSLHNALIGYRPEDALSGWRARFGLNAKRSGDAPMGLYLYGTAGVGKSMLMDMFFENAPVEHKRRVHFHEFMLEVHQLLKALRESANDKNGKDGKDGKDVIQAVAEQIAEQAHLLCFDEFHVGNITDAMILARLFENLLACGVVIVATSNIAPEDLYTGGLQRVRFLPFIDLLKQRFDVLHLDGAEDYRLRHLRHLSLYFNTQSGAEQAAYRQAFTRLTGRDKGAACEIAVGGSRVLKVPEHVGQVCRFGFKELCGAALAAQDYMALSDRFRVIFLSDVPIFTNELRNEMKRFILLVDVLYEKRAVLCMSAMVSAEDLDKLGSGGRDHAFEFQRTYSRLQEMRSDAYGASILGDKLSPP